MTRRRRYRVLCRSLLLGFLCAVTISPSVAAPQTSPPPSDFEEPPQPFTPDRARSEAEQDRVAASALFAHGRMLMQRQDFDIALRRFQRSWRYDAESVALLDEMIVGLAVSLKRYDEAARYAALSSGARFSDVRLLAPLAGFLSRKRDFSRALAIYEILASRQNEKNLQAVVTQMELGRMYFLTANFKKAAESFAVVCDAAQKPNEYSLSAAQVKQILGKAELTYVLFGESFLLADRLDEAAAMFRKSHEAKADDLLLAYRLARIASARDKVDAALAHLEKYLKAKGRAAGDEPYELLKDLLEKKSKKKAAEQLLQRLTKLYQEDKENAPLGLFLAQRLLEAKRYDEAEKIFAARLEAEPSIQAHQGLIEIARQRGKVEPLLTVLAKGVADAGTLEPLGKAAKDVVADAKLLDKLLKLAEKKKQQDPKSLPEGAPLAVAMLALEGKNFDQANSFFELALDQAKDDKSQLMATWGLQSLMAEQYDSAANVFQQAIDQKVLPKNNKVFYFYMAGALEMGGKTDQALEAARQAAKLDPKSARFRSRESWIAYHAKRYGQAEAGYRKLLEEFESDQTTDTREVLRDARLILSNISVQREDMPQAEEWLEQVLDEFPRHIGAQNDLGYLWADQNKRLNRALTMVQRAVQAEPDNAAYRDSLGWAYYRLGRYAEAVKELEKAAEGDSPDGVILDHLGDAYVKQGAREKALAVWRRAVKNFQENKEEKFLRATKAKIEKHKKK